MPRLQPFIALTPTHTVQINDSLHNYTVDPLENASPYAAAIGLFQLENTTFLGPMRPVVTLCRKIIKLHFQYSSFCVIVRADIRPIEEFCVICVKRVHFLLGQL